MASTLRQLASLVTALAISGAPAVLSACAALCVTGMSHAAMSAGHAPSPAAADCCPMPEAHAHHGSAAATPDDDDRDGSIGLVAAAAQVSTVAASDHPCCADGQTIDVASPMTARTDAGALVAQAPVASSSPFAATAAASRARASRPRAVRPSPARSPRVLRI